MNYRFIFSFILLFINFNAFSQVGSTEAKLLNNLSQIFFASKNVIFKKQDLINQKGGDKSSLFGEHFIKSISKEYKLLFGVEFPRTGHPLEKELIRTIKFVMEENRVLIEDDKIPFKGLIAATFAFQLSHKFSLNNVGVKIKFTAPKNFIRNKLNGPDSWEEKTMVRYLNTEKKKINYYENIKSNKTIVSRSFMPVYYEKSCLNCHGTPDYNELNLGKLKKNWSSVDITGFKMENGKFGEFAGGISVSITNLHGDLK